MKYDIFISYRRDGGEDKARLLNKKLKEMGFSVFFDHDAALRGEFETVIKTAIENSKVFLLLLTENCLERCTDYEDFVRKEIEYAVSCNLNIIPVYPQGNLTKLPEIFNVEGLPKHIKELEKQECATIDFHENFETTCEYQIKKVLPHNVNPTNNIETIEKFGADIFIKTDIPCIIYSYGRRVGISSKSSSLHSDFIRLRKGRHILRFESIEDEDVFIETNYTVPDNDYIDYIDVKLENKKKEIERKKEIEKENYQQYILDKRKALQQSKNYLILCSQMTSRFAGGVSQILQQIGNKCKIQYFKELFESKELCNSFDSNLYGKCNLIVFLSKDIEQLTLEAILKKYDNNLITVVFGNIRLRNYLSTQKSINLDKSLKYQESITNIINQIETAQIGEKNFFVHLPKISAFHMNFIEGGAYQMGDDYFKIKVEVPSFYMCTVTVTNELWDNIMDDTSAWDKSDCPAVNKPITKIYEFIKKINEKTGLKFYIPSEEEWEYAAREGRYSHGYLYSGSNALSEVAWYKDNSINNKKTRNVYAQDSTKHPNALGLYFMSGNVWEICREYGTQNESLVVRGGSFSSPQEECRVSSRAKLEISTGHKHCGLRLACCLESVKKQQNENINITFE